MVREMVVFSRNNSAEYSITRVNGQKRGPEAEIFVEKKKLFGWHLLLIPDVTNENPLSENSRTVSVFSLFLFLFKVFFLRSRDVCASADQVFLQLN